jgi:hypothetical protein
MKNFENNLRNDTVLNAGLLAIAIAWVAFAAVRGPAAADDAAGYRAPPAAVQAPAAAAQRTLALPAAGARADRKPA